MLGSFMRRDQTYLADIFRAADHIECFLGGIDKQTFECLFEKQAAVERNSSALVKPSRNAAATFRLRSHSLSTCKPLSTSGITSHIATMPFRTRSFGILRPMTFQPSNRRSRLFSVVDLVTSLSSG